MNSHRIRPDEIPWTEAARGLRCRTAERDSLRARIVEIEPGAEHPEWCRRGHTGIVLAGRMEIEFDAGKLREVYAPGDILLIPAGEADRHRPRAIDGAVRLFLVDH